MSSTSNAQDQALVVIGASAGGIDALERIAGALPAEFAAPVVIAQHLDPSHASMLDSILRQRTALKVLTVAGELPLESGTLYVVPAGANVEIADGKVVPLQGKRAAGPLPSIDVLFKSAAASFGDRTVGVILSGTGSDGPAGVLAIKEAGGTVVVQDPETATYPSLPSSIPPNLIDLMVGIDSIGGLLSTVVNDGDASARSVDPDVLHAFLMQLRLRSGIDFTQYKTPTIRRRLARLMAASRCKTLAEYMRYLSANPEAYQRLVSSFLIKVTGFFRDPALYKTLREEILPQIIAHARDRKTEIRIWSAGCATGEEAYSVAILFADILGEQVDEYDIRIFATDLDADSIAFARRGIYPSTAFTEMPPELLQKYFTQIDDAFQIKKRIRSLTVFGEYDLGQRAPFPRIDLVLCRNVLIYFTKDLQQRTLQLFAFSLREGGYLVLGKSETTSPLPQYFSNVHPSLKIFRRQGERLMVPAPAFPGTAVTPERTSRRSAIRAAAGLRRSPESAGRWSLTERLGAFVLESPIGIVAVDRNYDIQTINQAARHILGIHAQAVGEDLIHLLTGATANAIKSGIDEAFHNGSLPAVELDIEDPALRETRFVQISIYPQDGTPPDTQVQGAIVVLQDVTALSTARRKAEKECDRIRTELTTISKQNRELLQQQRSLTEANNELASANSDLRSANEHLLIAAEEAEASAEEVETLNEEMQATSEELETLNEELQATVEELNTTNEELGARGEELERLVTQGQGQVESMAQQSKFFEEALRKVPFAALVVDASNAVLATTEAYDRIAHANLNSLPLKGGRWTEAPSGFEATSVGIGSGAVHGRLITLSR
jgi:two-component system CheB/CheR fusion protein